MMQQILLFLILLLININANAFGLRTTIVVDTTLMQMPIANDSLYLIDSSQYAEKQTKIRKRSKSIKIITGMLAGAMAAYQASQANGYPMLFYGFLSLGLFISLLFKIKRKTYLKYLEKKKRLAIKRKGQENPKYNNSWNYSLLFGLLAVISFISVFFVPFGQFAAFLIITLAIIYLLSNIFAFVAFFLGFRGKYESKEKKNRGILKGVIGLVLSFLSILATNFI